MATAHACFVCTPDNLRGNPELDNYLAKLGTCKVEQLKKEQTRLADEARSILEQTQDLAISNYRTFITTAENSRSIFSEFLRSEQQLDTLVGKLPDLSVQCERFLQDSAELNEQRRLNSITLQKNAQLLEVLELPQLMERCIREGRYEEALELAAYATRLGQHQGHIPVVKVGCSFVLLPSWSKLILSRALCARWKPYGTPCWCSWWHNCGPTCSCPSACRSWAICAGCRPSGTTSCA